MVFVHVIKLISFHWTRVNANAIRISHLHAAYQKLCGFIYNMEKKKIVFLKQNLDMSKTITIYAAKATNENKNENIYIWFYVKRMVTTIDDNEMKMEIPFELYQNILKYSQAHTSEIEYFI